MHPTHPQFTTPHTPLIFMHRYVLPLGYECSMGFVVKRYPNGIYLIAAPHHALTNAPLPLFTVHRALEDQEELEVIGGPWPATTGHDLFFALVQRTNPHGPSISVWRLPGTNAYPPLEEDVSFCHWQAETQTLRAYREHIVLNQQALVYDPSQGEYTEILEPDEARALDIPHHYICRGFRYARPGCSGSPIVTDHGILLGMYVAELSLVGPKATPVYGAFVSAATIRRAMNSIQIE